MTSKILVASTAQMTAQGQVMWWLTDAEGSIAKTAPGHVDCIHRKYRLTCMEYERLLARANGHCEGCGIPDRESYFGRLVIDHASDLGWWAVRGLLCRRCNNTLRFKRFEAQFAAYYANAYFFDLLARHGKHPVVPPEPPVGSVVADHAYRTYERRQGGWWPVHNWTLPNDFDSWTGLVYAFGPHNLRIVEESTR